MRAKRGGAPGMEPYTEIYDTRRGETIPAGDQNEAEMAGSS